MSNLKYNIKQKNILVYGAGAAGKKLCAILEECDIHVVGYIDKRAYQISSFDSKPVFLLDELNSFSKKDDFVIIISIKNVFQHSSIVEELYSIGFRNLIFKSKKILDGIVTEKEQSIDEAYESLLGEFRVPNNLIDSYCYESEKIFDYGLIENNGDGILKVWIPAELIFSNDKGDRWSVKNLAVCYPAVEMYEEFNSSEICENGGINRYLEQIAKPQALACGGVVTPEWEKIWIQGRKDVFLSMKQKQNMDPMFFINNCPTVAKRKQGGFVLISSGKSRVSFLISQRYKYIPVKISEHEYEEYKREEEDRFLSKQANSFSPSWSPYHYNKEVLAKNYLYEAVVPIGRYINRISSEKNGCTTIQTVKMLISFDDGGYLSEFFKVLGMNVTIYKEECDLKNEYTFIIADDLIFDSIRNNELVVGSANIIAIIKKQENIEWMHNACVGLYEQLFCSVWDSNLYVGIALIK